MSKKITLVLIVVILALVAILFVVTVPGKIRQRVVNDDTAPHTNECEEPYVWDVIARGCVRVGAFSDDEKRALSIARDYIGGQLKSVVAQSVEPLGCEGCFQVVLLADGIVGTVELENWVMQRYTYGDKEYVRPAAAQ